MYIYIVFVCRVFLKVSIMYFFGSVVCYCVREREVGTYACIYCVVPQLAPLKKKKTYIIRVLINGGGGHPMRYYYTMKR